MADYTVDVFIDDETGHAVEVLVDDHSLDALSDVDLTGKTDGSVPEWDTATGKWIMGTGGGGGGAPTDAQYVTLATNGTLTNERVLTAGTGITITDAGAGSTVTVGVTASTYQPLDSDLTAIAALSTTTFGRALLALADAAAGRTALGLGGAATLNVGTTAGTVAAGDDSRITGAAQKASNLSDLANASTARTNLGLGSLATLSTITSSEITDDTIVNGDISTSAAIALSKLAQPAQAAVAMSAWSLYA